MKKRSTTERASIQPRIYVFLSMMIGFALFSFWPTAQAAAPTGRPAPTAVEQYAQQQADALGTSNSDWLAAELDYYPLGPGTHSWIVHASIQDKQIGYMIISITEQGQLILSEYGQGEQALYNNELLGQALERQDLDLNTLQAAGGKLSLRYAAPLLAYWKVEIANHSALYIDASNGDLLPSDQLERLEISSGPKSFNPTELQNLQMMPASKRLITSPVNVQPVFDPSLQLTWLTSEPLPPSQVQEQIQRSHTDALVFSAGEQNLYYGGPLPISGYQMWHTETTSLQEIDNTNNSGIGSGAGGVESVLYVGLGGFNSTQRFVPLNKLLNDGHFYMIHL